MVDLYLESSSNHSEFAISLKSNWIFENVSVLQSAIEEIDVGNARNVTFQCGGLQNIDISGAWVLFHKSEDLKAQGVKTDFKGFKAAHFKFLDNIIGATDGAPINETAADIAATNQPRKILESLGYAASRGIADTGFIAHAIFEGAKKPSLLTFRELVRQIDQTGVRAMPIVFLISFLMGLVMAYQGALQLQKFGATIFVVDMVAISVLREMGVLLAAIMVAGRSGSAFAASLGVMNLNQETDALRVMGLNPNQVLVLPRILALLISLPLLTLLSDFAGLAGGMVVSSLVFDIGITQYLERIASSTNVQMFMVGFGKAPVFALLIGGVATLRGLQIQKSAEELGRLTTVAVVQSIFLVILADSIFTVIFVRFGI